MGSLFHLRILILILLIKLIQILHSISNDLQWCSIAAHSLSFFPSFFYSLSSSSSSSPCDYLQPLLFIVFVFKSEIEILTNLCGNQMIAFSANQYTSNHSISIFLIFGCCCCCCGSWYSVGGCCLSGWLVNLLSTAPWSESSSQIHSSFLLTFASFHGLEAKPSHRPTHLINNSHHPIHPINRRSTQSIKQKQDNKKTCKEIPIGILFVID